MKIIAKPAEKIPEQNFGDLKIGDTFTTLAGDLNDSCVYMKIGKERLVCLGSTFDETCAGECADYPYRNHVIYNVNRLEIHQK